METYNDILFLKIAEICKSLSAPTRLKILFHLKDGSKTEKELMQLLELKQANLSKHLANLKSAGIVKAKKDKNNIYYSLSELPFTAICDLICNFIKEKIKSEERALGIK